FYLKEQAISIPDNVDSVYFRTKVRKESYNYAYSFDGETWVDIPINFDSLKLSDDYILMKYGGYAFFTGAFTGMFSSDLTGGKLPADFDYFKYCEL
ncbi:MAG: glycoside hydrolase 43 family protein, partial [Levilactobacillus brevis]